MRRRRPGRALALAVLFVVVAAAAPPLALRARRRALDNALVAAVFADDIPAAEAALARGARTNARDREGKSPLDFARATGDEQAIRLLKAAAQGFHRR